jgi:hypothetical protein
MEELDEAGETGRSGAEEPEIFGIQAQHVGQWIGGHAAVVLSDALQGEVEPVPDGRRRTSPLIEGLGSGGGR